MLEHEVCVINGCSNAAAGFYELEATTEESGTHLIPVWLCQSHLQWVPKDKVRLLG